MRNTIERKPVSPDEYQALNKKAEIAERKRLSNKARRQKAIEIYERNQEELLRRIAWESGYSVKQLRDPETLQNVLDMIRRNEIKPAVIKGSKSDPRVKRERKKGDAKKLRRKRRKQLGLL